MEAPLKNCQKIKEIEGLDKESQSSLGHGPSLALPLAMVDVEVVEAETGSVWAEVVEAEVGWACVGRG